MPIAFPDVFPLLVNTLPEYVGDEEYRSESNSYLFLNDMVRFVCLRESDVEIGQFSALIERLLVEGDNETRYLAMDAVETLACEPEGPMVASSFGSKGQEIWKMYYRPKPD